VRALLVVPADPVLLRRVGRDELLAQAIVSASSSEAPALEDEPVVGTDDRSTPCRPQRSEPADTGSLQGPLSLLRSASQSETPSRRSLDHGNQSRRPGGPSHRVHKAHASRPWPSADRSARHDSVASVPGSRRHAALVDEPALESKDPIDRLAVHTDAFAKAKHGPDPAVSERRMSQHQAMDPSRQELVNDRFPSHLVGTAQGRPRDSQTATDTTERSVREDFLHSSNVLPSVGR
jgi:hypothetical protein